MHVDITWLITVTVYENSDQPHLRDIYIERQWNEEFWISILRLSKQYGVLIFVIVSYGS